MLDANRVGSGGNRRKPTTVLPINTDFLRGLKVGDKGQLNASLTVEGESLIMDEDGNEIKTLTLFMNKATRIS